MNLVTNEIIANTDGGSPETTANTTVGISAIAQTPAYAGDAPTPTGVAIAAIPIGACVVVMVIMGLIKKFKK